METPAQLSAEGLIPLNPLPAVRVHTAKVNEPLACFMTAVWI